MKNPERVAELLAELRALTETDFERHRIDVLERDFAYSPTVEVIDDKHQRFDGVTYHDDSRHHFVVGNSIHRAVWTYYNGEIPEGYQIHHIDCDPSNNDISNLQCLSLAEHSRLHAIQNTKQPMEKHCLLCGKPFFTKRKEKKYCSENCAREGLRNWHLKPKAPRQCPVCGQLFLPEKNNQTCCSQSCARKLYWQKQRDKRRKTCPVCGKSFVPKDPRRKCCSQACSSKLGGQKRTKPPTEKICPVCGKSFTPKSKSQIRCSRSCAMKARHQANTARSKS